MPAFLWGEIRPKKFNFFVIFEVFFTLTIPMRIILYLLFLVGSFSYAQERLNILVESLNDKQPLQGAVIHFLGKHYTTDSQGIASIEIKKSGEFPIKISFLGYVDFISNVKIPQGNSPFVVKMQEEVNELSQVVVSSTKNEIKSVESKPKIVISKENLMIKQDKNLAEILSSVAGITSVKTGATIAKPVIHGLHSNRILILNQGVRQEGQQWGIEHAPEIDPFSASEITIVKGSESVKYGAEALGGVVLLNNKKLPFGDALHGQVFSSYSSNSKKISSAFSVEGSWEKLPNWALRLQGSTKKSGDYKTADYYLNNTGVDELNFSVETGFENSKFEFLAYFSRFESENGVFFGSHIGNLDDLRLRIEIGRPITTFDFSSKINSPKHKAIHHLLKIKSIYKFNDLSKLSLQYSFQDNTRQEFSVRRLDRSLIPALNMNLKTHILETDWQHHFENWTHNLGANISLQQNYNVPGTGVVPVIPNYASTSFGVFGVGQFKKNYFLAEVGLRYDYKTLNADGYNIYGARYGGSHNFHNITYSLGVSYNLKRVIEGARVSSNFGVAWRAPQVNELYSNGLHHGAGSFDVGDENLKPETGFKWINSLSYSGGRFSFQADFYAQIIKNYIFDSPTGEFRELFAGVFPIFKYGQRNAFFRGADIQTSLKIYKSMVYNLQASVVYANELKTKGYFPFIPSERFSQEVSVDILDFFGKEKKHKSLNFSIKHQFVNKQKHFDKQTELAQDTPDAYNLFSANLGFSFPVRNYKMILNLSAENLNNKLYKEYTNRFRLYAHEMGRNITGKMIFQF